LEIKTEDKSKFREYHDQLDEHTKLHEETRQMEMRQQRERSVEVSGFLFKLLKQRKEANS